MNKNKKLAYAKSVDGEKKMVTATVSTYEWDRTHEKFQPGAWDLASYLKNPVVLWGHNSHEPPIGRAVDIKETEGGLVAVTEFDVKSERGAEVFGLFERGFLNAFSVGFIPKGHMEEPIPERGLKGIVWTEAELLEYSAVSIPANPGALVSKEIGEMAIKCLGEKAVTRSDDGETYIVNVPELVAQQKGDLERMETSLNELISLARIVKGKPLDGAKLALVGTATNLLNEIITDNSAVSPADIEALHGIVKDLGGIIKGMAPESERLVKKTLEQIEKALR